MIKVIQVERDQSLDEELSKHYGRELSIEIPRKREPSPSSDPALSMLTGPKLYIHVQFTPSEYKPYVLTCFLDFGCQVNLARGSALPSFY